MTDKNPDRKETRPILVLCGMRAEARLVPRSPDITVVVCDNDPVGATRSLETSIAAAKPRMMVSFGIAGGLSMAATTGTLIVPSRIISAGDFRSIAPTPDNSAKGDSGKGGAVQQWPHDSNKGDGNKDDSGKGGAVQQWSHDGNKDDSGKGNGNKNNSDKGGAARCAVSCDGAGRRAIFSVLPRAPLVGSIIGVDRPLLSPEEKHAAHRHTGAVAVDMESHILARLATDNGIACVAIRAVCDGVNDRLAPITEALLARRGRLAKVARGLASKPSIGVDLIQLGLNSARALRLLGRAVANGLFAAL